MNLKYKWVARFKNKVIRQPDDDRYSKFCPEAEWNPSAFRDFQDYFDGHKDELETFELISKNERYMVDFRGSKPIVTNTTTTRWGYNKHSVLHREKRDLSDVRVIYYRKMQLVIKDGQASSPEVLGYVLGYQGNDANGNNRQKTIYII